MSTAIKHSKQRDAILDMLRSRTDHPTAETLYTDLKADFPKISLGTVYRNLALLQELGEIIKISSGDSCDRFDGNAHNHYHVVCKCCGKVDDVHIPVETSLNDAAALATGAQIQSHSTVFFGICKKCSKNT